MEIIKVTLLLNYTLEGEIAIVEISKQYNKRGFAAIIQGKQMQ
jgi:hypothetical protein